MAEKCSLSIKRLLQISLAIMLLFLLIISVLYYLFIYTFSQDQFESSFKLFPKVSKHSLMPSFTALSKVPFSFPTFPTCRRFFSVKILSCISATSPAVTSFWIT